MNAGPAGPAPETEQSGFLYEQVAFAAYGFNAPRVDGIVANLGTYPRNPDIDRTVLAIVFDPSQGGEDFLPTEHSASIACQ